MTPRELELIGAAKAFVLASETASQISVEVSQYGYRKLRPLDVTRAYTAHAEARRRLCAALAAYDATLEDMRREHEAAVLGEPLPITAAPGWDGRK